MRANCWMGRNNVKVENVPDPNRRGEWDSKAACPRSRLNGWVRAEMLDLGPISGGLTGAQQSGCGEEKGRQARHEVLR